MTFLYFGGPLGAHFNDGFFSLPLPKCERETVHFLPPLPCRSAGPRQSQAPQPRFSQTAMTFSKPHFDLRVRILTVSHSYEEQSPPRSTSRMGRVKCPPVLGKRMTTRALDGAA